jgi:hypothetical protein
MCQKLCGAVGDNLVHDTTLKLIHNVMWPICHAMPDVRQLSSCSNHIMLNRIAMVLARCAVEATSGLSSWKVMSCRHYHHHCTHGLCLMFHSCWAPHLLSQLLVGLLLCSDT